MSFEGDHSSENEVIVVLSPELITKSIVGLVDLNELLAGLWVALVVLGMVFERELPIGGFDLIHRGISGESENGVVV